MFLIRCCSLLRFSEVLIAEVLSLAEALLTLVFSLLLVPLRSWQLGLQRASCRWDCGLLPCFVGSHCDLRSRRSVIGLSLVVLLPGWREVLHW